MGFDPLSLGVMAAGAGLSTIGSGLTAGSQAKNGARQAAARNEVLRQQNAKLDKFAADNRGDFNTTIGTYDPNAQTAQRGALEATRAGDSDAAVNAATGAALAAPTGFSESASPAVAADFKSRMADASTRALEHGRAGAKLQAYDDSQLKNDLGNKQLARNIDTTNNYARGTAALTAPLQDFAQFQAYRPPSMLGGLVSGVGSLLSNYGGYSLGKGTSPFSGLFGGGANTAGLAPSVPFAKANNGFGVGV